jgi:hypothetical protein
VVSAHARAWTSELRALGQARKLRTDRRDIRSGIGAGRGIYVRAKTPSDASALCLSARPIAPLLRAYSLCLEAAWPLIVCAPSLIACLSADVSCPTAQRPTTSCVCRPTHLCRSLPHCLSIHSFPIAIVHAVTPPCPLGRMCHGASGLPRPSQGHP